MASIWDTIKVTDTKRNNSDGATFTIHYSTEKVVVRCANDMSLDRALRENGPRLGYDGMRSVTWRDANGVVSAATIGQEGASYTASVALETKG